MGTTRGGDSTSPVNGIKTGKGVVEVARNSSAALACPCDIRATTARARAKAAAFMGGSNGWQVRLNASAYLGTRTARPRAGPCTNLLDEQPQAVKALAHIDAGVAGRHRGGACPAGKTLEGTS